MTAPPLSALTLRAVVFVTDAPLAVELAVEHNRPTPVLVVAPPSERQRVESIGAHWSNLTAAVQATRGWAARYRHSTPNSKAYERFCFQRWLIAWEALRPWALPADAAVAVLDSDILLFRSAASWLAQLAAAPAHARSQTAGVMIAAFQLHSPATLQAFADFLRSLYAMPTHRLGGVLDRFGVSRPLAGVSAAARRALSRGLVAAANRSTPGRYRHFSDVQAMEAFCAKGWRCSVMDHSPRRKIADAVQPYGAQAADCAAEYVVTVNALGGSKLMYHAAASAAPPAADDGRGCGPLGHDKGDGPRWAAALRWRARRPHVVDEAGMLHALCLVHLQGPRSKQLLLAPMVRRGAAPAPRPAYARRRRLAAKAADPIVPEIWLPSATTPTALRAVFLANTRCARCSGAGQRAPLWLNALPLTAHPGLDRSDGVFKRGAAQADFVLAALRGAGLECTDLDAQPHVTVGGRVGCAAAAARPGEQRLVLADWKNWHFAGLQGSATGEPAVALRRVRGFYAALRELLRADGGGALPPAGLLMHVSEWALEATLDAVGRVLAATGVDPRPLTFAHYNHGTMRREYRLGVGGGGEAESTWAPLQRWSRSAGLGSRKPRLSEPIRQAWWSNLLWIMAVRKPSAATKKVLKVLKPCGRHPSTDAALPGGDSLPPAKFLLLGGRHRYFRGLVTLALAKRGLLVDGTARWSGGRYGFCDGSAMAWAGQRAVATALAAAAPPESRAPFSADEERRLLGDASLVRRVCAALPRVLDVAPDSKADAKVLESSWALWRGVRFALTFESDMVAHDGGERLFITEKSLKPMEHGLPFVMLGSPGTLAVLRALGFRSFAPAINESYDEILDGTERLRAALAEAARLAEMGDEAWRALVSGGEVAAALRHNLRHMHCGGLKRTMADLALSVVDGALVVPPAPPPPPPPPPEAGWFSRLGGWIKRWTLARLYGDRFEQLAQTRCVGACTGEFLDQV